MKIECPYCKEKYYVKRKQLGMTATCGMCEQTFTLRGPNGEIYEPKPLSKGAKRTIVLIIVLLILGGLGGGGYYLHTQGLLEKYIPAGLVDKVKGYIPWLKKDEPEAKSETAEGKEQKKAVELDTAQIEKDIEKGFVFSEDKLTLVKAPKNITTYSVPNGVTMIGKDAFSECGELESITLPESVEEIGKNAFSGCILLANVNLSEGLEKIGKFAFSSCEGITSVTIPKGVTDIGDGAFEDCKGLESVEILEGVTTIGERAFKGCEKLSKATLPSTLKTVGEDCFFNTPCFPQLKKDYPDLFK